MKLIADIPDKDKFNSCILSTYTFDYNLFEYKIKPELQQKGISNIIVLFDANNDYTDLMAVKDLDYSLIPINRKGIFHPKLQIYTGKKNLMMHVGSGNLTMSGLGINHELFSTLACNNIDDPQFDLIQNGLNYLVSFLKNKRGTITERLKWIIEYSDLLKGFNNPMISLSKDINSQLNLSELYNGNSGIYDQLKEIIPRNEIIELDILSPFWDDKEDLLLKVLQDYSNSKINIYVNGLNSQAPIVHNDRIRYLDFEKVKRNEFSKRNNHSKVFVFHSQKAKYILHGSANASSAGLGLGNYKNEEFVLLYKTDSHQVESLGLHPKHFIDAKNLIKIKNKISIEKTEATKRIKLELCGVDKSEDSIEVFSDYNTTEEYEFVFIDSENIEILRIKKPLKETNVFSFKNNPSLKATVVVFLLENNVRVSPFAYVTDLRLLSKCNPNFSNQKKLKLLHEIQFGKVSPLDLLEYLSFLIQEKEPEKKDNASKMSTNSNVIRESTPISFEEAKQLTLLKNRIKQLNEDGNDVLNALKKYHSLNRDRILDKKMEDDNIDVDDFENNYQEPTIQYIHLKSERQFDKLKSQVIKHLNNYISKYKNKISKYEDSSDENYSSSNDIMEFLFMYTALVKACTDEVKIGKEEDQITKKIIDEYGFVTDNDSFSSWSIQLAGHFMLFLELFPLNDSDDFLLDIEFLKIKRDCHLIILFGMIRCMQHENYYNLDTFSTLHYKLENFFGELSKEHITEYYSFLDDQFDSSIDYLRCIDLLQSKNDVIRQELKKDVTDSMYYHTDRIGICRIYQKLPLSNPKSLKFYYPGFNYISSKRQYIYPYIYNIANKKWYLSKQEIQY